MYRAKNEDYSNYLNFAESIECGKVYPLSIVQGFQPGDIITDNETTPAAVMFWHKNGFAYISGQPTAAFLEEIYSLMASENKRLVVLNNNCEIADWFRAKDDIVIEERTLFRHTGRCGLFPAPAGYTIADLDEKVIDKLEGRIVPASFWNDTEQFVSRGRGFCVMHEGAPIAWAFTSAISRKQIDIGIEVCPDHRGKGLAVLLSSFMVHYVMSVGKEPVWGCHTSNLGSCKTAARVGFEPEGTCFVIRKRT
ncbi:MAG: GNAT family N-acetyltransferase [Clostridia bacterium]|nr:GNAT family N-acetyltransferase [Clostridia bacterium]